MSVTDGTESNVILLHIYDLTRGLAAQLSPALIGKLDRDIVKPPSWLSFHRKTDRWNMVGNFLHFSSHFYDFFSVCVQAHWNNCLRSGILLWWPRH